MKKKKLKTWPKVLLVIVILLGAFFLGYQLFKGEPKKEEKEKEPEPVIDYVTVINEKLKDENLSLEFLSWVNENYPESLKNLDTILNEKEYDTSLWHEVTGNSYLVLNDLYNKKYDTLKNVKIMETGDVSTISFAGDVSLADNWYVMPQYDKNQKGVQGILSQEVLDVMTGSDLMIVNSEFTVSNRGSALNGKLYTFRAKPERLSIYGEMGVDLVTLANNHVYDYGKDAFLDMLDSFDKYQIPHIGAGHNLEEASTPYYFIVNGYKIAFLNGTRAEKYIMTPGATENSLGVFRCYDPTNMINKIKEVKKESDYVFVIMHFGKEGYHELEEEQVDSAKKYIDAGADAIVGHHAHALQGIEIYKDKPIVYNLGDFIFNNETEDSAIFQIKLSKDGTMEYYILPALQKNVYTSLLSGTEKSRVIKNLNSWSINAQIDEDGKITKK